VLVTPLHWLHSNIVKYLIDCIYQIRKYDGHIIIEKKNRTTYTGVY
jgi:hypothetical protein